MAATKLFVCIVYDVHIGHCTQWATVHSWEMLLSTVGTLLKRCNLSRDILVYLYVSMLCIVGRRIQVGDVIVHTLYVTYMLVFFSRYLFFFLCKDYTLHAMVHRLAMLLSTVRRFNRL